MILHQFIRKKNSQVIWVDRNWLPHFKESFCVLKWALSILLQSYSSLSVCFTKRSYFKKRVMLPEPKRCITGTHIPRNANRKNIKLLLRNEEKDLLFYMFINKGILKKLNIPHIVSTSLRTLRTAWKMLVKKQPILI